MKKQLLIIALSLSVMGPSLAYSIEEQAPVKVNKGAYCFQNRDINKDGNLSLEEFSAPFSQEKITERFHAIDSNGDGILNQEELRNNRHKGHREHRHGFGLHHRNHRGFSLEQLDTNKDGVLLFEEFVAPAKAKRGDRYNEKKLKAHFDNLDSNGDGQLSEDEISLSRPTVCPPRHDRDGMAGPHKGHHGPKRAFIFERLDENKDGSLTFEEFIVLGKSQGHHQLSEQQLKARFDRIDSNGDESLSKEEFQAVRGR